MKNAIITLLATILIPFLISFTAVRLLATPFFLSYEYKQAKLPQNRLETAQTILDYLVTPNKELSIPQLNKRELGHLLDVKQLLQKVFLIWKYVIVFLLLLAAFAWYTKSMSAYLNGIMYGSWFTIGLIIFIGIISALAFDAVFSKFHELFFIADTWLFYRHDLLIQLFPFRFWQDSALYLGLLSLALSFFLILIAAIFRRLYKQN